MLESFQHRSTQSELMDDPNIGYGAFRDCLRDLAIVNICSLAYRPVLHWLRDVSESIHPKHPIYIIDVGSGGGDTLWRMARWAMKRGRKLELTGVDLNPWSRVYAREATPADLNIAFETADIFNFASDRRADFIISSLFTHHLTDEQLVHFLRWMENHANQGWMINDLHRHPVAYFLIKYISKLFHFHYMVQNDGPISVARAFTKAEWIQLLMAADIPLDEVEIRWFFPFRYRVMRQKP